MSDNGYIYASFVKQRSPLRNFFSPELEAEQLDPLRNAPNTTQQNQNQTMTADDLKSRH